MRPIHSVILGSLIVAAGLLAGCVPSISPQPGPTPKPNPAVLTQTSRDVIAMEQAAFSSLAEVCAEISRDTRSGLLTSPSEQQQAWDRAVEQINQQKLKALATTLQRDTRAGGKWDSEQSAAAFDGLAQGFAELSK